MIGAWTGIRIADWCQGLGLGGRGIGVGYAPGMAHHRARMRVTCMYSSPLHAGAALAYTCMYMHTTRIGVLSSARSPPCCQMNLRLPPPPRRTFNAPSVIPGRLKLNAAGTAGGSLLARTSGKSSAVRNAESLIIMTMVAGRLKNSRAALHISSAKSRNCKRNSPRAFRPNWRGNSRGV